MIANGAATVELADEECKELEMTEPQDSGGAVGADQQGNCGKTEDDRGNGVASGAAALQSVVSTASTTDLVRVRRAATTMSPTRFGGRETPPGATRWRLRSISRAAPLNFESGRPSA